MAKWVKCSPQKHEDLSLAPQHFFKRGTHSVYL